MGRTSNAAKAVTKIINIQKRPGFFIVTIKNSDGKVIFHKSKVSKEEYLDLYLKNLENNITNHPIYCNIANFFKSHFLVFTFVS